MVISNTTQTFILSVVDANQEYNTKFILLCLLFIYLIFFLWWSNRLIPFRTTREQRAEFPIYQQAGVKVMRFFSITFLVFYPLLIGIFMYRLYDIDSLITLLIIAYSVLTSIGFVVLILFGFEWVIEFLGLIGIKVKKKSGRRIIRRRES